MRHRRLATVAAAVTIAALAPRTALACGGTFCDSSGPMQMSVDQSGENIVFVQDGATVEAHIQIQVRGGAPHFGWVIPVPVVPDAVEIGSEALFTNLLLATAPAYGFSSFNDCTGSPSGAANGRDYASSFAGQDGDGSGDTPNVVFHTVVGAFDVKVLEGGKSSQIAAWLGANGLQEGPDAGAILDEYLAKNYRFVVVRLDAGEGDVHPLVIRYKGNNPCVPLKLTRVAAVENMGVRAFFLAKGRTVPTNYKHVVLNGLQLDWRRFGVNYSETVSVAVDSAVANGHAFVTEYAGPSDIVARDNLAPSSWNPSAFPGMPPELVVQELAHQGLVDCSSGEQCVFRHPLVAGLLREFLPVPVGLSEATFYGCLSCYKDKIDASVWNGASFGKAMVTRIVAPAGHARAVLQSSPYLTRLWTTISPAEMTEDPEFHRRDDLPEVPRSHLAIQHRACNGQRAVAISPTRTVALSRDLTWPTWTAEMPFVDRVEEIPLAGAPIELVDNTARIDALLAVWNASQGWPPSDTGGSAGAGGARNLPDSTPTAGEPAGGGCSITATTGSLPSGIAFLLALIARVGRRHRAFRSAERPSGSSKDGSQPQEEREHSC